MPENIITVESLASDVVFNNPEEVVKQLNFFLNYNKQFDAEYQEIHSFEETEEPKVQFQKIVQYEAQQASPEQYYVLVETPKNPIHGIEEIIIYNANLNLCVKITNKLIGWQESRPENEHSHINYLIQNQVYRFCNFIFLSSQDLEKIYNIFKIDIDLGHDGYFRHLMMVEHLAKSCQDPAKTWAISNMRLLYRVFCKLLLIYCQKEMVIPKNLQKILSHFQQLPILSHQNTNIENTIASQREQKSALVLPNDIKRFFAQYKNINSAFRKSIFLGSLLPIEQRYIFDYLYKSNIQVLANMYVFIGKHFESVKNKYGRQWLSNLYHTIRTLAEDHKIVEDTNIPEKIRKIFGEVVDIPVPNFSGDAPTPAPKQVEATQPVAPPVKEGPKVIDIKNLIDAQTLPHLKDQGTTKKIVIVQDSNILDQIIHNWEVRGSLTFPELIEFARIPIQIHRPQTPGLREGRVFLSFAYFIALNLPEETIQKVLIQFKQSQQIPAKYIDKLSKLYPSALEQIGQLQDLLNDQRPILDKAGRITPLIFFDKCTVLQKEFFEQYSYIQGLLAYWTIVEDIFYSIARSLYPIGEIQLPREVEIQKYVQKKNEEYFASYEKALLLVPHLRRFFKKKYSNEIEANFVNVKVYNDLLRLSKTQPIHIAQC